MFEFTFYHGTGTDARINMATCFREYMEMWIWLDFLECELTLILPNVIMKVMNLPVWVLV